MKTIILLAVIIITNTGCATIFTGMHDKVYFHTEPENAKIKINKKHTGNTPEEIKVKRSIFLTKVTFTNNGFHPHTITLEKQINPVYFLNFFNIIGFGIDVLTGSVAKYDKVYYDIKLEPVNK